MNIEISYRIVGGEEESRKMNIQEKSSWKTEKLFSILMNLCVTFQTNSQSDKKNYKICSTIYDLLLSCSQLDWLVCDFPTLA